MPIHSCNGPPRGVDALWTYVPDERINFRKFRGIRSLHLECYQFSGPQPLRCRTSQCTIDWEDRAPRNATDSDLGCGQCSGRMALLGPDSSSREEAIALLAARGPYTMPPLKELFPNLEMLTISNISIKGIPVFLGELTSLPTKLKVLSIGNTHIQNIGEMIQSCDNLIRLHLSGNVNPINMISLPPRIQRIHMYSERLVHQLPVSTTLNELICRDSSLPEGIANLNPKITVNLMISGCVNHPYDDEIIEDATTVARYHARYRHINRTNADRICLQLGSIPKRIRMTHEDDRFNPIIVGLTLASNIPRRMAEFVAIPSIP